MQSQRFQVEMDALTRQRLSPAGRRQVAEIPLSFPQDSISYSNICALRTLVVGLKSSTSGRNVNLGAFSGHRLF